MNANMKEYVMNLLDGYHRRAREIALLRYELAHPVRVTDQEMIGAMNFARQTGTGHPEGHISDKTFYIALNYQEQASRLNDETTGELSARLIALEREQARLEYYMSLLEPRQAQILQGIYIEKKPRETVAEELGLSVRRLQEVKALAVDNLTEMYDFTSMLH